MSMTRRFSVQFGGVAAAAVTLAVVGALTVFILRMDNLSNALRGQFATAIENELRRDAERAMADLAVDAHNALLDYDPGRLERLARRAAGAAPGARVRIFDHHGRLMAATAGAGVGLPDEAPENLRGLSVENEVRRWRQGEALFSGQAVCVREVCLGTVEVGINGETATDAAARVDAAIETASDDFFVQALALAGVAMIPIGLGAAGFGFLLGRRLQQSIDTAVDALEQIRDGARNLTVNLRDQQMSELETALETLAERLADERERNEKVSDSIDDGLFVARPGGRIVHANPALHAMLGQPDYALFGCDAFEILKIEPTETAQDFAEAAAALTELAPLDGPPLPILASARVAGEPPEEKVVGVIRDGRELAEALAKAQTAELRAEAAEKAREEFLSVMSHELRTPLNGVLGGAAVLAGTELTNAQRKFVDIVQNSGSSMLDMVTSMLDFARLQSGDATLNPVPTDLDAFGHRVFAALEEAAAKKRLKTSLRVQPGAPTVLIDADKLAQVVDAITDNAVRFTDSGRVDVSVTHAEKGGHVLMTLAVTDTGRGIAPEQQRAIFEGFRQADNSATRADGGAGLGLALAGKLTELLGGDISVDSTPGSGSTFTVKVTAPLEGGAGAGGASLRGVQALVVGRDRTEREALAEQLAYHGMATRVCGAASEALIAIASNDPPALVVHAGDLAANGGSGLRAVLDAPRDGDAVAAVELGGMADDDRPAHVVAAARRPSAAALIDAAERAMAAARAAGAAAYGAAPKAAEASSAPPEQTADAADGKPKVLLAEGSEIDREVVASFLRRSGYEVVTASSGFEAVQAFKRERPHVVLIASELPIMPGHEAVRAMRRHEKGGPDGAETPILFIVGNAEAGGRERGSAAGATDFIAAPISTTEIAAKIERHAPAPAPTEALAS